MENVSVKPRRGASIEAANKITQMHEPPLYHSLNKNDLQDETEFFSLEVSEIQGEAHESDNDQLPVRDNYHNLDDEEVELFNSIIMGDGSSTTDSNENLFHED
jgi:hypothetical protein